MINAGNQARMAAQNYSPQSGGGGYGSASDWASILASAGQGAGSALQSATANASSRAEAKEAKRRTLANLLNGSLKRSQGLFRAGQEHSDELSDYQSQAMQQMARGFVEAMNGINR
jgi:hypothetical protein